MAGLADIKEFFTKEKKIKSLESKIQEIQANYSQISPFVSPIYRTFFTGEKTPGEMGAAKDYQLEYNYLRIRSWQSYLESEITQSVINKFVLWVVGSGLKVQPEPQIDVLKQEGINSIPADFIKQVETRFRVWSESIYSDHSQMFSMSAKSSEAFKNAIVGGDVLVVLRFAYNNITVEHIDGAHVCNPYLQSDFYRQATDRGNEIKYGVEVSSSGEHIAYYVCDKTGKCNRIPRKGEESGRIMAFLVYGNRYRIDNVRGLPLISAVLETLRKLDRYKEATVGSAEERQKIAFSIEHNADSTGENPLLAKLAQSSALGMGESPESKSTDAYEAAATKVATTTNKQAINMPIGATLKLLESKNELYFKDFYSVNRDHVCSAIGIPPEVAMDKYDSNYSASRGAVKSWDYSMKVSREKFSDQYHQPFYNLWLEVNVLLGKINAPGYIKAINDQNIMAIEAYNYARWLGANVPHIDPVAEVKAERLKLGDETIPLTTFDQATESLGTGDFSTIAEKVKQEKKAYGPTTEQSTERKSA